MEQNSGRGVVEVAGAEARALLQRLITNDVDQLAPGEARYAALLTPQGKILVDFIVVSAPTSDQPERFLLDCPAALAADLARRLTLYRLRARVLIADRSADLTAVPLGSEVSPGPDTVVFADPRSLALGQRAIGPRATLEAAGLPAADEAARRVAAGVPAGGVDFAYGDAFPHEANLDLLSGVDFTKGCYVGQEVVSRMQHRATVRKRVTPVRFDAAPPASGAEVTAGDLTVGTVGSVAGQHGLALIRLDRAAEASQGGIPLTAEGRPLTVSGL